MYGWFTQTSEKQKLSTTCQTVTQTPPCKAGKGEDQTALTDMT